jgi:putative tricarboxylic transport membrane protein
MGVFARRGDFWSGLALAALATYILAQARAWPYMTEEGPGPGFFPMWYGGAMLALSLVLVVGTVFSREAARGKLQWGELRRAFACWVAFVACIAVMPLVGFVIAFGVLTWFIVAVLARRPQRMAIGLAIGMALVFYVLFDVALGLSLPHGVLF